MAPLRLQVLLLSGERGEEGKRKKIEQMDFFSFCIFLAETLSRRTTDEFPSFAVIENLLRQSQPVPVKFCVVTGGIINFFEFREIV